MNTIVLYKKLHYTEINSCENMTILKTEKTVKEVKQLLDEKAQNFLTHYKTWKAPVDEVLAKIKPSDYNQEELSETMKEFEKHHQKLLEYSKDNYIFELDNQFLDIREWLFDREKQADYEIMLLEDWVEQQHKIVKTKPDCDIYD